MHILSGPLWCLIAHNVVIIILLFTAMILLFTYIAHVKVPYGELLHIVLLFTVIYTVLHYQLSLKQKGEEL